MSNNIRAITRIPSEGKLQFDKMRFLFFLNETIQHRKKICRADNETILIKINRLESGRKLLRAMGTDESAQIDRCTILVRAFRAEVALRPTRRALRKHFG